MSELFDSEFLRKLQNLVVTSKIVLENGTGGNRKSRSKGSSVEFSDYREYSSGDDFRRIDWNAYGRFEKLFVKLFMEEREAPVSIFLDTSKSMDWGEPNKNIASRRLAAALGYMSLANYDRLTIACISSKPEQVKLSLRGRNSFAEVLGFLEKVRYDNPTDIYAALRELNLKAARGISIVISDLFSKGDIKDIINYLLYRKQDIYICHMLAPQEVEPQVDSSLRLIDSETGEFRDVTATAQLLRTYKKVFSEYISGIEGTCFKRGVNYIRMDSSMPIEQMIKLVIGC